MLILKIFECTKDFSKEYKCTLGQEKQSQRNYELDKIRVSTYRDVAVEYAKNQPKTITYNNIY